jgi:WD40 repeat protein/uncharacterized caspase-like protein
MQVHNALAVALLLIFFRGTGAPCQTTPPSSKSGNSLVSFRLSMDQPRPMAEVLGGSFSVEGKIQIITRTILVRLGDAVQSTPLLGDPVGAYVVPDANGGMAVQMSPFGETQQIPVPADFGGLHGIPLAPQTQVQKIAASRNSQVLAIISHGFAPAPFLLMIMDGIRFKKLAELTLSDESPSLVRVSGDGGTIAVGYVNGLVRLWNVHSQSELPSIHTLPAVPGSNPMIGPSFLESLCLSEDGSHLFLAQADLRGQIVNLNAQGAPIVTQLPGHAGTCSFDPEDTKIAVGTSGSELLQGLDGKMLWVKTGVAPPSSYSLFREDGKELLFIDHDGAHIRRVDSGDITLSFTSYISTPQPDWTAWSPAGRFDGSQEGIRHLRYSSADTSSSPVPVDALVRDYYTPGLVGNILADKTPLPVGSEALPSITQTVHLRQDGPPSQSVNITVDVTDADKEGTASVRLFRNGVLVKRWQNLHLTNSNGATSLNTIVALLPGVNHLLAYSYDANGTKSADAVIDCQGPPTVEPGTLHVLAVGINSYKNNRGTTLNWSEADANLMAQVLSAQRAQINQQEKEMSSHPEMKYSREDRAKFARAAGPLDVTPLSSDDATRENILSKIRAIVAKAKPQDTVILFFAGHGTNRNGTFYFLTSDIAAFDSKYSLDTVPISVLTQGAISDRDLEIALEPLDAGSIAVIFDACESGQVLVASNDVRRGPVNAQGFAQLAFEKGISLLAAAPSSEEAKEGSAALESKTEGHGWLTYELGVEGLQSGNARVSGIDASIYIDAMFRYAAQEVPKHIAQKPTIYVPNRPAADQTLIGFGAVVLDPNSRALFQGGGNSTAAPAGNSAAQHSLGDLTLQDKDQKPAMVTSVSFEGNQLVVTLARTSRIDQTRWGSSAPVVKTLSLDWKQLNLNPLADVVEVGNDGQYLGVDTTKLTTYPLPAGWKDEARILIRNGTPIGVVQSEASASGGSLQSWDISKNQLLWSKPSAYLGSSAISADGKLLALNVGRDIQLLQSDSGTQRWPSITVPYEAPFDTFQTAALSEDGTLLATSAFGGNPNITVWNLPAPPSDRMIWITQPHDFATQLMLFSAGAADSRKNMLAAVLADGTISVYQWQPKGAAQLLNSGGQKISAFSVSPDGSRLVLGTTDGVISLFDLAKSTLLLRLRWIESAEAWVAQDDAGHFDAPRELWKQLTWSQNGKLTGVHPSQYADSLATKVLGALPAHP